MGDVVDECSQGKRFTCPYCTSVFEDMDPAVALGIRNNHIRRKHPFAEE